MIIKKNWLNAESFGDKIAISKTANAGDLIDPDYIAFHYTATDCAAIDWPENSCFKNIPWKCRYRIWFICRSISIKIYP